MEIKEIIFYLLLIGLWIWLWWVLCSWIGSFLDALLEHYKNYTSKNEVYHDDIETIENLDVIKELFLSLQGMWIDSVIVEEDETYLPIYDKIELTISLLPSTPQSALRYGCFLVPSFKWHVAYNINSKQKGQLVCSYKNSLEEIADAIGILEGKKMDNVEFLPDAIRCHFEGVTLCMEISQNDWPACCIELFPDGKSVHTLVIKPEV